jgi:hypothetical protein
MLKNGKISMRSLLDEIKKETPEQELRLIKKMTKFDKNERFRKPVVG